MRNISSECKRNLKLRIQKYILAMLIQFNLSLVYDSHGIKLKINESGPAL